MESQSVTWKGASNLLMLVSLLNIQVRPANEELRNAKLQVKKSQIKHTLYKANYCVDALAKLGISVISTYVLSDNPLLVVENLVPLVRGQIL